MASALMVFKKELRPFLEGFNNSTAVEQNNCYEENNREADREACFQYFVDPGTKRRPVLMTSSGVHIDERTHPAMMATICETVEESILKPECKEDSATCNKLPNAICYRKHNNYNNAIKVILNVLGIIVAILASYMIINTDSKLYIIFWLCYSVLRRMMLKSKKQQKCN
ncbi:uncharacterized protein LOC131842204 [Achroia grisella]|uniref:uncharacterized protein LOC131842204 n=1 Tax=Achroia grisella TaxID=688607 RepID=UPI0027D210FC|nr:uncharacterized protein LOC131842204 [Achroia grisella]